MQKPSTCPPRRPSAPPGAGGPGPGRARHGHAGLADGQQPGAAADPHGEPRFGLLETIREYALERLRDGADWREAHDRHAAYFRALAEPAPAELRGALALSGTGFGLFACGDQAAARPLLEQSLPLYRQAGDMLGAAMAAGVLGHLLALQHQKARREPAISEP